MPMRVVPYDEINDPTGFAVLTDSAFGWPTPPGYIATKRKADPRYRDPYGFGLLQDGTLMGFVGVIEVKIRTRSGTVISCGGIHHVMTRPGHARKGIARRLMEHCHDWFRSRGYPISFLFTSRVLVAVGLYEKLGYVPLPLGGPAAPSAFLVRSTKGRRPKPTKHRPDYTALERLFALYGQNETSFVRDPGWLKGRMDAWQEPPERLLAERSGYAYVETDRETASVRELVAADPAARLRLVLRIEELNRPVIRWYSAANQSVRRLLRERGYSMRADDYGLLMALPLTPRPLMTLLGPHFAHTFLDRF